MQIDRSSYLSVMGEGGVLFMTFQVSTFISEMGAICPQHAMHGRWHCILLPKPLWNYQIQNKVICMAGCKCISCAVSFLHSPEAHFIKS